METPIEENLSQSSVPKISQRILSLREQLLYRLIPVIIFPLLIANFVGYSLIKSSTENQLKKQLVNAALLTQASFTSYLQDITQLSFTIGHNPSVLKVINDANQETKNKKLTQIPISKLEEQFQSNKLVKLNSEINTFLQNVTNNSSFNEILVTEKFGFNVAYSSPIDDFVQRDEAWWQQARSQTNFISEPVFDEFNNILNFSLIQAIRNPQSNEFIGVIKGVFTINNVTQRTQFYLKSINEDNSKIIQIIDVNRKTLIDTIALLENQQKTETEIIGGTEIIQLSTLINQIPHNTNNSLDEISKLLRQDTSINNIQIEESLINAEKKVLTFSFKDQNRQYILTSIPQTSLVIVASISKAEITAVANNLLSIFFSIIVILLLLSTIAIFILARKIASPLQDLAFKTEEAALGNLEVRAELTGSTEVVTLANSFNNLIQQVEQSIKQQKIATNDAQALVQKAEKLAQEQQSKNTQIQQDLLALLQDVEGASSGDLTVRSQINEGEIGIVADFFNSIIESLREIVAQVKDSTQQVNLSVGENQTTITQLATEANQQATQIAKTLTSVEQITESIKQVAQNAKKAAKVAHIASNKAELGGTNMTLTVNSIQQLRNTIGQTADKVRNLGEASQTISRVISLINQIAMQTNLLSINASIEAARAGEEGKGFAVVAEEVGELATQSSEATKEIATIIAGIQQEVFQVVEVMEVGLAQAEEGTSLVEKNKKSLQEIVAISYEIDRLVSSISQTTVAQAETSQTVSQLMEEIAQISTKTSQFSQNASNSLELTVAIAKKLQSSVGTFKIDRPE